MAQRITIQIRDKIATCLTELPVVCGNSDYVVDFDFDQEWDEHRVKTARFIANGEKFDVVFEGIACPMPPIFKAKIVWVGVYAGNISTSTPAIVYCKPGILDADGMPPAPRDDVYAQILEKINDGSIKGDRGERGEKGEKGDAGAIKFISVVSLPTENIDETAIYLVPIADGAGENRFTEYAYIDGKWETLGAISIQVDHSEYVKFTDMNEALGGKVDKVPDANMLYATGANGEQTAKEYDVVARGNTIPVRNAGGEIYVFKATTDVSAVPLKAMNEALDGKLDKLNSAHKVYCTTVGGVDTSFGYSQAPNGSTFALRRSGGVLAVSPATKDDEAVPLAQLNTILDERIGSIETALDDVHAYAQALKGGAN